MNRMQIGFAVLLALALSPPVGAFDQDIHGWDLRVDNKFSVGAAWRVQSRDPEIVGIANGGTAYSTNGDDGNLGFDAGEVVSSAAKLTTDLSFGRGSFGVFLRGSYVFNPTLNNHEFFNAANYNPPNAAREAPRSEYEDKTRIVRNYVGSDADLLDAYVFGVFNVGFTDLAFRIGRQVINWGESTLVQNGINSMLAADVNQLRVPGFEIDEVLIPTSNLWISFGLFGASVEAFYQLDWQGTVIDASGTFWSSNDFAGIAGTRANLRFGLFPENSPGTTVQRAPDVEPDDDGQWGLKLGYLVPLLNDIEIAAYAMNYHSRLPLFSGTSGNVPQQAFGATYFVEYPEDIQLYGASFNTAVGDWSLQGEYSYKVDQPLQIEDVELLLTGLGIPSQIDPLLFNASGNKYLRGFRRHDVSQVDLGLTRVFGPWAWLGNDQLLLLGEVAMTKVHDLPSESVLYYEGPATYKPGANSPSLPVLAAAGFNFLPGGPLGGPQTAGYPTSESYGYKIVARATFNSVLNRFTVEPTLRFDHDFKGISPTPITNFVENRKQLGISAVVGYLQQWQYELGYTRYFGGGQQNLLQDRDFVEAAVKYSF